MKKNINLQQSIFSYSSGDSDVSKQIIIIIILIISKEEKK